MLVITKFSKITKCSRTVHSVEHYELIHIDKREMKDLVIVLNNVNLFADTIRAEMIGRSDRFSYSRYIIMEYNADFFDTVSAIPSQRHKTKIKITLGSILVQQSYHHPSLLSGCILYLRFAAQGIILVYSILYVANASAPK